MTSSFNHTLHNYSTHDAFGGVYVFMVSHVKLHNKAMMFIAQGTYIRSSSSLFCIALFPLYR